MDRLTVSLALLFASVGAGAGELVARPEWQQHFAAKGVKGTFVLLDPARSRREVLDLARAKHGYLPASTFKIPNALIALEVGSLHDEAELFRWDGKPRHRPSHERDHDLRSGMRESVVWMFQEVARRTGKAAMKEWLDRLDYGNRDIGGGIEHFWLQGGLRISALQQVDFLHKLAEGRLPMTQRSQRIVRDVLVLEKTREYTLHGKTGTTGNVKEPANWWVGWIERKGRVSAVFAMNYTPVPGGRFEDRFEIGRAILRDAGALPTGSPPA